MKNYSIVFISLILLSMTCRVKAAVPPEFFSAGRFAATGIACDSHDLSTDYETAGTGLQSKTAAELQIYSEGSLYALYKPKYSEQFNKSCVNRRLSRCMPYLMLQPAAPPRTDLRYAKQYTRSILFEQGTTGLMGAGINGRWQDLPVNKKIIYNPQPKKWQPSSSNMIIGAVFAGLGAAGLLIPPTPDFSSDGKVGPQMLFVFSASSFLVGTGAFIAGVFHHTKVDQQPYYPSIDKDQMKLTANADNKSLVDAIEEVLNMGNIKIRDSYNATGGIPRQVKVYYDHIEFMLGSQQSTFSYRDLYMYGISTYQDNRLFSVGKYEFNSKMVNDLNKLKENFNQIRNTIEKQASEQGFADQLAVFKPFADKYRSMYDKPVMSEDQRKKVIQANVLREQGNFKDAITTLNAALEMDPVAYPSGYANLAFLYERILNYEEAILNMKKYLMLVPDAEDARDSQDKIYEWELMLNKK